MSKLADIKREQAQLASVIKERIQAEKEAQFNKTNKAVTTSFIKEQIILESLDKSLKEAFKHPIKPSGYALKKNKKPIERILNVCISDTHFQTLLSGHEGTFKYGAVEEARALSKVVLEAVEYKPQYRDNTKLLVHLFGDLICGAIHDARHGATITDQIAAATYLLSQAIYFLSQHFPSVEVKTAVGNHGRNPNRHKGLAVDQKWDSFETSIHYGIKLALATVPNVKVEIPLTPYYTWQAFDKFGFITHGDGILSVGYPSQVIDIKKIRNQVNEFNAGKEKYDLFMIGHVHCGSKVHLPSGTIFMSNGSLIPSDNYALSVGYPHTNSGQWLFESSKGYIVGDSRYVSITEETYNDKSLDSIIKPYLGLDSNLNFSVSKG